MILASSLRRFLSRPLVWTALASLALHLLLFGGWLRASSSPEDPRPGGSALLEAHWIPASGPVTAKSAPRMRTAAVVTAPAAAPAPAPAARASSEGTTADGIVGTAPPGPQESAAEAPVPVEAQTVAESTPTPAPAVEVAAAPTPEAPPAVPTPAPRPPAPLTTGRWQLRVHYGDYTKAVAVASLDYVVSVDRDRYTVRTEGRAEGLASLLYSGVLTQSSQGVLGPDGLEPEQFAEQRGKRPERRVQLDRGHRRVRFPDGTELPSVEGVQDRLSVLLQLGVLARAHPERFAAGRTVVIPELSWRDIEAARYLSHGEVRLPIERGELRTLHLERTGPRRDDDPLVELWLGYDHGLVPVRIRLTDPGGRVLDQMLVTQP